VECYAGRFDERTGKEMKLPDSETILNMLVPDSDLRKTADNYQPDPPAESAIPEKEGRFGLWMYEAGEDDTGLKSLDSFGTQMPEFEGAWGEVVAEAQRIAQDHGFWLVNDDSVMGGHWQNANGDVMQIE